jgi:ABC-type arginine transport system ATPase subunit
VDVSCIAKGADALFAEALLAAGGQLVVVLRSQDYRQAKVKPDHAGVFDRLIEAATEVVVMPHEAANRQAHEAANLELLPRADRLVAVWDGRPPSSKGGGTADTVVEAQASGLPVDVAVLAESGQARVREVDRIP